MSTPYRNEIEALRDRKSTLETELTQLREQTRELASIAARQNELEKELATVDAKLRDGATPKRALPMLDQVKVASPCNASWDDMLGDDRVRFCLKCDKNVFNLSAMSREDAEALLRERIGNELCVRFYQRADGTLLTQDCPVGVTKKRRKKVALAVAGAGAMALAATSYFSRGNTSCPTDGAVMGQMPVVMGSTTGLPVDPPPPPASANPPPPPPANTNAVMGRR
jgi:hypothetical protein